MNGVGNAAGGGLKTLCVSTFQINGHAANNLSAEEAKNAHIRTEHNV